MSQFRLAHIGVVLAALGLNAAYAQTSTAAQPPGAAQGAAAQGETVRPDLFKLLDPAAVTQLMAEKKYAEVQNRITQAEAFPARTAYENYVIDRMRVSLGSTTGNDAMAIKALENVIASGRLPPADQPDFILALSNLHYNAKDYPKAIEWSKRYQKDSPTPARARPALIRAYYLSGDYAMAKTELLPVIAEAEKARHAPSLEDLRLLASSAGKVKDMPTYLAAMEKLVAFYPSDEFWTDLLSRTQNKAGYNDRLRLDFLRLENVAIKSMSADEYAELAELALSAGYPTEARKTVEAGYAAGVLGTGANASRHKQLRDRANKGAADDARNIAAGEAAADKNKDGLALVNLGYAYATMDQFDKGIALMEKGIAKGVVKRPEEARLHLGVAYAKAGRKDDAIKAFSSVKGQAGLAELARYWTLWLNRPAAASVAAAPAR